MAGQHAQWAGQLVRGDSLPPAALVSEQNAAGHFSASTGDVPSCQVTQASITVTLRLPLPCFLWQGYRCKTFTAYW